MVHSAIFIIRTVSFLLSVSLFCFVSFVVKAEVTCPQGEVRLDRGSGPLVNFKVQDQGEYGMCYAEAAAVMLTAASKGHEQVSALDVALKSEDWSVTDFIQLRNARKIKNHSEPKFSEGGDICEAFNQTMWSTHGPCPLKFSPLETRAKALNETRETIHETEILFAFFENLKMKDLAQAELLLQKIHLLVDQAQKNKTDLKLLDQALGCKKDDNPFLRQVKTLYRTSNEIKADLIWDALKNNPNDLADLQEFLASMLEPECRDPANRLQMKIRKSCEFSRATPHRSKEESLREFESYIIPSLTRSRDPLPVGLSICSSVLTHPKADSHQNTKCSEGGHAVTAIGVRTNEKTHQCEVLVLNSWGSDWCPKKRKDLGQCTVAEGGKVWIPAEELAKNYSRVESIGH